MRKPLLFILFVSLCYSVCAQQAVSATNNESYRTVFSKSLLSTETVKLAEEVNSPFEESYPLISPDDRILYFVRENHPQNIGFDNQSDVWAAYRQIDGSWARAINLGGPLNNREHNYLAGINSKGNQLIISSYDHRGDLKEVINSKQKGRLWSFPNQIHFPDDSLVVNRREFSFSIDGTVAFFTAQPVNSARRGIYFSFHSATNGWSHPKRLNETINSNGTECAPYIAADGKTLYFAAKDKEDGFGGYDIYTTQREDDDWNLWKEPRNLGGKINTGNDELGCSVPASGDVIYFSSGNKSGKDIYRGFLDEAYRPTSVVLLSGRILDAETFEPFSTDLNVQTFNQKEKVPASVKAEDGYYHMLVPQGLDIGIYAEQEGYFPVSVSMELSETGLEELDHDEEGMLAQAEEGMYYSYSGREVEKIQLRLKRIDDDLKLTERERKIAYRARQQDDQNPNLPIYSNYRSDPELDALRHRYKNILRQQKESLAHKRGGSEEPIAVQPLKTTNEDQKNAPQMPPDFGEPDEELLELRNKFNRFYYNDEDGQRSNQRNPIGSTKEEKAFGRIEREMIRQLRIELQYNVMREIQEELLEAELLKAQKSLEPEQRKWVNKEFRKQTKSELRKRLKQAEKAYQKQHNAKEGWFENTKIEKDLKKVLTPDVKNELKEILKETVRTDIHREFKYQIKVEQRRRLAIELQENMLEYKNDQSKKVSNYSEPISNNTSKESSKVFEYSEIEKDILLLPLKEGQVIPLNNIFFEANTIVIKQASYNQMDRVLALLEQESTMQLEIGGHTNGWVERNFAKQLSQDRADAIKDYFTSNGIAAERITTKGYGSSHPLTSNTTLEGRKENQRIEFRITKM